MKRLFFLFLLLSTATAFPKVYYVAPNGNDADMGTKIQPLATIQKAQELVNPGDTVYIRGGLYKAPADRFARKASIFAYCTYLDKSGNPNARINYWAYPGEHPLFDFSEVKPEGFRVVGFQVMGSWIHIKGLEVTGIQVTITTHTESYCFYSWGSNNIFELLSMHDNKAVGIRHRGKGVNNLFLNCDSYRNYDSVSENKKGGNTDGFGCHPLKGGTGNVFRGCRSWFNSDDGFDILGSQETVTFENCWAMYNGFTPEFVSTGDGNGFKGGGYGGTPVAELPSLIPQHRISFCLAVRNKAAGFYSNHHLQGSFWSNNTAYRNSANFNMLNRLADNVTDVPGYTHELKNNLSYKGGTELKNCDLSKCISKNNTFDMDITFTDNDFVSLDESLLTGPRKPDGSLPETGFMKIKPTGKLFVVLKGIGY